MAAPKAAGVEHAPRSACGASPGASTGRRPRTYHRSVTHKKKWDRPLIDHKDRSVLGQAPVERLDFVFTVESTEQFYVNDSWRAFPEGVTPVVEDNLNLGPPIERRADGVEQILTSNGSCRRERARLATLSVLGHDMVCDGASQTSESRRGRFFFGIGARDATPEPVARWHRRRRLRRRPRARQRGPVIM